MANWFANNGIHSNRPGIEPLRGCDSNLIENLCLLADEQSAINVIFDCNIVNVIKIISEGVLNPLACVTIR